MLVKFFKASDKNGFLSNWWKSDFTVSGHTFNCVEQYMMWSKAMLFKDTESAQKILSSSNPHDIKALGRKVKNFDDAKWCAVCRDVVFTACYAKFTQSDRLKSMILKFPSNTEFVECSPYDRRWGIGLSASDTRSDDKSLWQGSNWLGECLSKVRKKLE